MRSASQWVLVAAALFLFGCRQPETPTPPPTVAATATAVATPTEMAFSEYENAELGLNFAHPPSWIVHEAFSGLTAASSQQVIDSESLADIGDEAFVNMIPGELGIFGMQTGQEFEADQPLPIIYVYQGLLENEGQEFVIVEPPAAAQIGDKNVATVIVRSAVDDQNLVTILAVVIGEDDFMTLVSAGALDDSFDEQRPTLERIIDSIQVYAPVGLQS
jgi:hypothetical protein